MKIVRGSTEWGISQSGMVALRAAVGPARQAVVPVVTGPPAADPTLQPVPLEPLDADEMTLPVEFSGELKVRLHETSGRWVLTAPLTFCSHVVKARITAPVGFDTDFASVPRFPPVLFALAGDTSHEAAVIHDYLYRFHQTSRRTADAILFEAMTATHEPEWRDWLMWLGVRVGGAHAWRAAFTPRG